MRSIWLVLCGGLSVVVAIGSVLTFSGGYFRFEAYAEPSNLTKGCSDVPEVVQLAIISQERSLRVERYIRDLEERKKSIDDANAALMKTLVDIGKNRRDSSDPSAAQRKSVEQDVSRLVAVYDQMKPEQAAGVISNLPPEFAAEILMRVQPENSARIMSAVDPNQAAILTSYMGSRRARQ